MRLIAFFILSLLIFSCKHQVKTGEIPTLNKKHPAGPKIRLKKTFTQQKKDSAEYLSREEEFDSHGFLIRLTSLQPDGRKEYETTYRNDEQGNAIYSKTIFADSSWSEENRSYKGKNPLTTEWKKSDGTSGKHVYKYDEHDNMLQWDWYENGKFSMSRLYPSVYDKDGRQRETFFKETANGHDTIAISQTKYTYNNEGRMTEKISLQSGWPSTMEQYIYDSLGNRIIEASYVNDSLNPGQMTLTGKKIYNYNPYGDPLETRTYSRDSLVTRQTCKWDDYGNPLQLETIGPDDAYLRERYEYIFWK